MGIWWTILPALMIQDALTETDVARYKPAWQSSTYGDHVAAYANDEWYEETMAKTFLRMFEYWAVDMEESYTIASLYINGVVNLDRYGGDSETTYGTAHIVLRDQEVSDPSVLMDTNDGLCLTLTAMHIMDTVTCDQPVTGRYLYVLANGVLKMYHLRAYEVSSQVDVVRDKPAWQSSTLRESSAAGYANDGLTSTVSSTDGRLFEYWAVDLKERVAVGTVYIAGEVQTAFGESTATAYIALSDDNVTDPSTLKTNTNRLCFNGTINGELTNPQEIICEPPVSGRYLYVLADGWPQLDAVKVLCADFEAGLRYNHVEGGTPHPERTDLDLCKDECLRNVNCTAVDYSSKIPPFQNSACWLHDTEITEDGIVPTNDGNDVTFYKRTTCE